MYLILGFGETGASFVRYLQERELPFLIMDSRLEPPGLSQFGALKRENLFLGGFDANILSEVKKILVSPGIEFDNQVLTEARNLEKKILTDIDVFCAETNTKTILVTGTNGKTTVVSMVGHLLKRIYTREKVACCGNIGTPVLDTLSHGNSISVVEVSSFHLENSTSIYSDIGVLLNITQDHLDRHLSMEKYSQIKQKILMKTNIGLIGSKSMNCSDLNKKNIYNFEYLLEPFKQDLSSLINQKWPFHELENIKAVIAIYIAMEDLYGNLDIENIDKTHLNLIQESISHINSFERLPHTYELLGIQKGVTFINDSKSTNLSSLEVALESSEKLYGKKKVVLICGGDSKGQDFSKISEKSLNSIKQVFIFGKDKEVILNKLFNRVKCSAVMDLEEALNLAKSVSQKGEIILLSPACASTDMFSNFKERGEKFRKLSGFN